MNSQTYALRRTSIAACFVPGDDLHIIFQDLDGQIREVWYKYGVGYLGGNKASVIPSCRDTKYNGPLAVVASEVASQRVETRYHSSSFESAKRSKTNLTCFCPIRSPYSLLENSISSEESSSTARPGDPSLRSIE